MNRTKVAGLAALLVVVPVAATLAAPPESYLSRSLTQYCR